MKIIDTRAALLAASMAALALSAGATIITNGPTPPMAELARLAGSLRIHNGPAQSVEELEELVQALTAQLRNVSNQSRSIIGRADAAGRDLSDAEAVKVDDLSARFDGIERELKSARQELLVARADAQDSTPVPRLTSPNAIASSAPTQPKATATLPALKPAHKGFSAMFKAAPTDPYDGRFENLADFALAVWNGNDSRLLRNSMNPMSTGEAVSAGYLVPHQFVSQMMDAALAMEVVRPRANVFPMTTKTASLAVFDTQDGTNNARAGLTMFWGAEGGQLTEQKAKTRSLDFEAKKGNVFVVVSQELAADGMAFSERLTQAMVSAVAANLDYAFINGTGAGMPLGMINAPCTIEVAKESGQAANTLLIQNLMKMVGRLAPASFTRATWLVHPTLIPQLYGLSYLVKNVAGTENVGGGHVQAVTQDAQGNLRIFGRPAVVTDACSVLSARGDIVLADLSKYAIGMRQDMRLVRDESRYIETDEVAFKLTLRLDGAPEDSAPTKLRDGTNTVSSIVVLQAR